MVWSGTHHGTDWCGLHERVVKDLAHVRAVALANLAEVVDERGVEQRKLPPHAVEVALHVLEAVLPELADDKPARAVRLVHVGDEPAQKVLAVVLDGVEAEPLERQLGGQPLSPVEDVLLDLWVVVVEI